MGIVSHQVSSHSSLNYLIQWSANSDVSQDDGLVTLTPEDIAVLSIDKPSEATTDVTAAKEIIRKRTIRGNTSLHTSLMLNTTVSAQDIWKDIDELTIENNTSKDNSTMVNYPIQTDDLVKILRAQRGTE